jgi:large subunit ribosomal protein L4
MAVADVLNISGEKISELELDEHIFDVPVKQNVLHEVVNMQLAKKRAGTASVKRRSDVKGSGRKLYRQKGTGHARAGDIKSPVRRGGGVIFGPNPRSYVKHVTKKVCRQALCMALTVKNKGGALIVLDDFEMEEIKTKRFVGIMQNLNVENALIITDRSISSLELSSRNVPSVKVLRSEGLNVYDILKYDSLILLVPSVEKIKTRLTTSSVQ